ncbi:uncharacterized protein si:dkey-283b1.6 [Phyllopteryx taeniolatus]|uniref:uncharacterized protein si:dkey-283b1.6 n=1 Tax=Phyllopteryx taeniolatus TaxID=161469 RepID=UPI002AD54BC2|nr:uncharacterized protein si:dkey-283b1.6 [Phyllopteryx taeniolatus]XP_061623393.1 uncharacterized protein si:dkey-283b1.6 [Phyllopteryx taeniolatus]XP_061623394.1 uncharacterized protein si:dkey-283b1.6 [Phyllopteryx taeniolatus]
MSLNSIAALDIFLALLGIGLLIMFCTTFCSACSRLREEQIEREAWRHAEENGRPPSIFFIPFPGSLSQQQQQQSQQQDEEEHYRVPRYSQEAFRPPQYNASGGCSGPPPSYTELGFKPDDLPPAYTEYNVNPVIAPVHTDVAQSPTQP